MNEIYFTNIFYSFKKLAKYHIQIYDSILNAKSSINWSKLLQKTFKILTRDTQVFHLKCVFKYFAFQWFLSQPIAFTAALKITIFVCFFLYSLFIPFIPFWIPK